MKPNMQYAIRNKLLLGIYVFATVLAFIACDGGGGADIPTSIPLTDDEAVTADAAALSADDFTYAGSDSSSHVAGNFIMPTSGANGTTISWVEMTDIYDNIALTGEGNSEAALSWTENNGFGPYTVAFIATVKKGTVSTTKDISVTVHPPATTKIAAMADGVTLKMVLVPGGLTFPTGVIDDGTGTVTNAYFIGETEVTYELWQKVCQWAINNSYTFANPGRQGDNGSRGMQHPVTMVNCCDSMVWCNALTEWYNAMKGTNYECVYTYNNAIIRDSQDSNATACYGAVASSTAKGFRLLTSNEWELAARYRGTNTTNVVTILINGINFGAMALKWTKGNSASGATTYYNDNLEGAGQPGKSANDAVAVYSLYWNGGSWQSTGVNSTAAVKCKAANALCLYDMSGNVYEWCFDLKGANRVRRGGRWSYTANFLQVGEWGVCDQDYEDYDLGFRFAKTQ
jgi:formylglycine-generating enzyme required for sulfatase activity